MIGSSGMGQSPSNFEGSRRHGLSLLRSPSDNDVLKSGRLGEVSQENKSSNISLVNCISARDNLRTSEDLVGMAKLSSLATKEPSKLVSLRELSQKSEGSGSSLLSQLSAKASSGIHGDQTGFSALEKLGSLRELSQANKSCGKSMLSLLSAKGQRGIAEDQGGLCSVSDLSCREPGNLGSLGELCEKKDNSGFSLLRQSRGSTAESSSSKCLSDKKNKNIVSLRELSQMGDDTGKSPLSQLLKTRSLETPKDLKGLSSLAGLPRNAPENRVSSKKATQNKLSFGNTATDELTANERNVNTETPSLKTLLSRPPDSNNTSSSLYTSSLPLQSGLSGSNSSKSDYFMPSLCSLLNPPEENKFSSRHKLADTSPKVESGAVVNLGEVTLTSLSGRFTNDGPETKVNDAKNGTKSKQTTSSLDLFMSSSLSSITGGDSRERASGVLQLSSLSGVGSSESRKGLKISSEEHTNSAAVLSFYGTPKTGISLAQRTTTLGNQLEYGVTQLVPDVQRPAGKVDLSVSLKRVRPKQETKNTSELTHSRGLNSTTSLERSIGNLNLNNSEPDLDEVDGGLRDSSVDVEDGFHMLATEVEECCISGRAAAELIASPTMFARTLLVKYRKPKDVRVPAVRGGFFDCRRELLDIVPFDFSTPSPDDLVKSKQKGVLGRK